MNTSTSNPAMDEPLIPWYVNGVVAIICAAVLIALVALGILSYALLYYMVRGKVAEWRAKGVEQGASST